MKWLLRVSVLIAIAMLPGTAFAQSQGWDYWLWRLDVGVGIGAGEPHTVYSRQSEFGVSSTASDGYDGEELIRTEGIASAVYAATYHAHSDNDGGWLGSTGFYDTDIRAPVPLQAGQSKSWLIYVWATPDVPESFDTIYLGGVFIMPGIAPDDYNFTLKLVSKPEDINGAPALGTNWELVGSGVDIGGIPIYRTDNGLNGYQFELTATAVPEPSSLLGLTCGLSCLAAILRHRRS